MKPPLDDKEQKEYIRPMWDREQTPRSTPIKGSGRPSAKLRRPALAFVVFVSPMLTGIVLGPFDSTDTIESYLDLLTLVAFVIAVVQVVIGLFKRSLQKIVIWALI